MAAPFLIRAVNELLSDIGGKGKKLLDVSCKEGDILESVKDKGFVCRGHLGDVFSNPVWIASPLPVTDPFLTRTN